VALHATVVVLETGALTWVATRLVILFAHADAKAAEADTARNTIASQARHDRLAGVQWNADLLLMADGFEEGVQMLVNAVAASAYSMRDGSGEVSSLAGTAASRATAIAASC